MLLLSSLVICISCLLEPHCYAVHLVPALWTFWKPATLCFALLSQLLWQLLAPSIFGSAGSFICNSCNREIVTLCFKHNQKFQNRFWHITIVLKKSNHWWNNFHTCWYIHSFSISTSSLFVVLCCSKVCQVYIIVKHTEKFLSSTIPSPFWYLLLNHYLFIYLFIVFSLLQ